MKGLLGRKIGMTQVYTDHGQSIAVSVVEVKPNVVTSIFTKEKDGYTALQLGIVDIKKHLQKKPQIGHFKKAKTTPKKFVKEIRGMEGFELGQTVDASIFTAGQLVDVTGTAKGKGFAGTIKRYNQSIGPKSHGGGGGSKPVRQTGSLGDISGNKVVKGMTMPGQMGNVQRTQQNLEVISVDITNNLLLIKGSIPGPKKSYVVVKEAVKLLPSKEAKVLVNVKETQEKNELLEEAKKAGADVNTDMTVQEMRDAIKASAEAKEQEKAAAKAAEEAEKANQEKEKVEAAANKAKEEAETKTASGDQEGAKEAQAKAEALEKQAEVAKAKADEVKEEAKKFELEAEEAKNKAEELQVETEDLSEESEPKQESENNEGDK